jgi:hypothetical protein
MPYNRTDALEILQHHLFKIGRRRIDKKLSLRNARVIDYGIHKTESFFRIYIKLLYFVKIAYVAPET